MLIAIIYNKCVCVQVGAHNGRAYAEASARWVVREGVRRQTGAFRRGFGAVFPPRRLRAFSPAELRLLVCGERGPVWTRDHLLQYTEPKLGYTRDRYTTRTTDYRYNTVREPLVQR